ncbi:hypothetical protein HDR59_04740 [bacterium]|nr:hypothetical protein [bacterium]
MNKCKLTTLSVTAMLSVGLIEGALADRTYMCKSCSAGTYSTAGASSCSACTGNTYSNAGASSCTACASGYIANSSHTGCDKAKSCDYKFEQSCSGGSICNYICSDVDFLKKYPIPGLKFSGSSQQNLSATITTTNGHRHSCSISKVAYSPSGGATVYLGVGKLSCNITLEHGDSVNGKTCDNGVLK